jgi:uncharacterized protein (DUF2267 family)
MMIRGMYYDGWNPGETPIKIRDRDEFMEYVREQLGVAANAIPADEAFKAVVITLQQRISPGELEDLQRMFPEELQYLWA